MRREVKYLIDARKLRGKLPDPSNSAGGTRSVPGDPATLIVPTLQRGNASQDALRPAVM